MSLTDSENASLPGAGPFLCHVVNVRAWLPTTLLPVLLIGLAPWNARGQASEPSASAAPPSATSATTAANPAAPTASPSTPSEPSTAPTASPSAASQPSTPSPESEEVPVPTPQGPRFLLESSGLAIGLEGRAGLLVLATERNSHPHVAVGALSRVRYNHFELGVEIEISNASPNQWRAIGGFAGLWLPFRRWVDLEVAAGVVSRTHISNDHRYGPTGYSIGTPALTFRVGVSDRSSESLFGVRLGAAFVASYDLVRTNVSWQYSLGSNEPNLTWAGVETVGGFSAGLAVTAGFDVVPDANTRSTTSHSPTE